jgi:hypothetical protein
VTGTRITDDGAGLFLLEVDHPSTRLHAPKNGNRRAHCPPIPTNSTTYTNTDFGGTRLPAPCTP